LFFIVMTPALSASLLLFWPRSRAPYWVSLIPGILFVYLVVNQGHLPPVSLSWVPSLGLNLDFRADGLGLLFGLVITGIGTLVLIYAGSYFDEATDYHRFSAYTLLFMTAMLGIVFSANLLLLFMFWELTSITSYLLIGFKHEKDAARNGARRALLITGGGGLALLAGFLLLGITSGTFDLPSLLNSGDTIRNSPLYVPALLLILVGAFSKSAQWPLHFWLPGAMEAPTPASAYLHSATMVKAGVFLLARLSPVLNHTDAWFYSVTIVGLITFLYGGIVALRQTDLKAILAYSTVSWLGMLVALQGPGSKEASKALAVGILAHALYKGALFLMAGSIDHATGTRNINQLGRLGSIMRYTALGALLAAWSMAGLPPLLGFLAKETLKVASLESEMPGVFTLLFPAAAVIGSALTVAVALRLLWDTFFGTKPANTPHTPHEVPVSMWGGPLVLGIGSVVLPLMLPQAVDPLVNGVVAAVTGKPSDIHLHLFEGINLPFLLSALAIVMGIGLFLARKPIIRWLQARPELNPTAPFDWAFSTGLSRAAETLTTRLQSGRLRSYISVVVCTFILLVMGAVLAGKVRIFTPEDLANLDWQTTLICILLAVGAISGVIAPTRLSAIVVLGIEGALVALLFALFGAPDIAFTQLMIEVVSLVLFVLAFHFLPDTFVIHASRLRVARDWLIAIGVGVTVATLVLVAGMNRLGEPISPWYQANAVPIGQGHNIVNVILVDFRGLDTQGEIVVLVIAAMGVAALLRLRPSDQPRGQHITQEMQLVDIEDAVETKGEKA
jgi:multicomponent Na+:H+ antiporter subunit A